MSHPINDEILDNYREEMERIKTNLEALTEAATELYQAYNSRPQDSEIKWLNGKFAELRVCLESNGVKL